MKKITIDNGLIQYQFPPDEGQHFGYNIHALIDNDKALLIDTAFQPQARAVKQELAEQNIVVDTIIFSHFHPDHISGLPELGNPKLYGSEHYQETLEQFIQKEKHCLFKDIHVVNDRSMVKFGAFNIKFIPIQGHVDCAIFTVINDRFVQVADDLMTSNEGEPLLPSVSHKNAQKHFDSLERLKVYASGTLLLSHGNAITSEAEILEAIQQRQSYLKAIADNSDPIDLEFALRDCSCNFLHTEWHDYVYSH